MAAYVIGDIEVLDPAGYEDYRQRVPASIAAYGGRFLAAGGRTQVLEGAWSPRRCVLLEFPTLAAAQAWWDSPEYAPLRVLRERTTRSNLIVTDGMGEHAGR